ncbi:MAG: helix-hairpin-helix domain-containing protein, partial [Promethearchaeota archaeon]
EARIIFIHDSFQGINVLWAEITLIGIGGAAGAFSLLPDRLGRKRVFTIASLLLAELCLFGNARATGLPSVIIALTIGELFVLGFILGVGVWLIWSEIGSVRLKGRRAALGWLLVATIAVGLWAGTTLTFPPLPFPTLVYPIAATLLFVSIIPLTNATEVIWNERIIESLEIKVDSQQVSAAIRELEIDAPIEGIQQQVQSEIAELAKIHGVTKTKAKLLRDQGYESIELVAQSDPKVLAQVLGVSLKEAEKMKASAEKLVAARG